MTHAERIHLTAALEAKRLDLAAQLSARIREIIVVERALRAIDEEVEAGHNAIPTLRRAHSFGT